MTMTSTLPLVHRERAALVELMRTLGPEHSTLCAGWTVRDLASHIVVRERRLDAALGIVLPLAAKYTEKVMAGFSALPFDYLLAKLSDGPSKFSPLHSDSIAARVNTLELVVHHEDVRRSVPGWTSRDFTADDISTMWNLFQTSAPLMWRRAHVPVTLMPFTGTEQELKPVVASKRHSTWKSSVENTDHIIISGHPVELILASFGRTECTIRIDGSANAQKLFANINRSV